VRMISRGVEISIAGGEGEMVCVPFLGQNHPPYIGIFPQPKPWLLILLNHTITMPHSDS